MNRIYLIGSLRNPAIPQIGNCLRLHNIKVFDDWYSAGPKADDHWQEYEKGRGRTYKQALSGDAAKNVYAFDVRNLYGSSAAVLVMPAGKSGHLELGYMAGLGRETFILFDREPESWDVMYQFATDVFFDLPTFYADMIRRYQQ